MMAMSAVPSIVWKIFGALALILALVWGFREYRDWVFAQGYEKAVADRRERDKVAEDAARIKADKETKAAQEKAEADAVKREKERLAYEKTIDGLRAAALRGNSGMRAPGPRILTCPKGQSPGPAGGPVPEEGYVILPETAASVLDAAAYIRQSVLDRNALIDKYEACRATANAQ